MRTDYHYNKEAMKYSSVDIPKILFVDKAFNSLTIEAKLIYGILLDRMSLSGKNGWIDEEKRVYILYPIEQLHEDTGLSARTLKEVFKELEDIGLIETQRQGHGKPNIIYVKNCMCRK
ncbi:MAG: replication initiator protein A [Lachnospiraceae bacterium]|nr:replication initiator protein A [Lachnospiraceae bacterium]